LLGYGKSIDGPLPNDYLEEEKYSIEKARELLENKGWKLNEFGIYEKKNEKGVVEKLSFNISTGDIPELKNTATILQSSWQKIGANVEVKIFETGDLNQNVIRPRKYESLLFGEIIGKDLDLFPFWHSSERNDPGLNIAMYTNAKVDKLLEDIRKTTDKNEVDKLLNLFEEEVKKDTPAIFIYSPEFIYINNKDIKNVILTKTTIPADRFQNVNKWYIETNKIWKIFNKDNN
jgi:peptide/nickel transport system substrate-binding protein